VTAGSVPVQGQGGAASLSPSTDTFENRVAKHTNEPTPQTAVPPNDGAPDEASLSPTLPSGEEVATQHDLQIGVDETSVSNKPERTTTVDESLADVDIIDKYVS
jgi:hypothetical protein